MRGGAPNCPYHLRAEHLLVMYQIPTSRPLWVPFSIPMTCTRLLNAIWGSEALQCYCASVQVFLPLCAGGARKCLAPCKKLIPKGSPSQVPMPSVASARLLGFLSPFPCCNISVYSTNALLCCNTHARRGWGVAMATTPLGPEVQLCKRKKTRREAHGKPCTSGSSVAARMHLHQWQAATNAIWRNPSVWKHPSCPAK